MKTKIVYEHTINIPIKYNTPFETVEYTVPCTTYIFKKYDRKFLWWKLKDQYIIEQVYDSDDLCLSYSNFTAYRNKLEKNFDKALRNEYYNAEIEFYKILEKEE